MAPSRVFVTHGEEEVAEWLGRFLKERTGRQTSVPYSGTKTLLE
ncbi:hypothetical protein ACFLTZ_06170 [Chloroflexota bacterium]